MKREEAKEIILKGTEEQIVRMLYGGYMEVEVGYFDIRRLLWEVLIMSERKISSATALKLAKRGYGEGPPNAESWKWLMGQSDGVEVLLACGMEASWTDDERNGGAVKALTELSEKSELAKLVLELARRKWMLFPNKRDLLVECYNNFYQPACWLLDIDGQGADGALSRKRVETFLSLVKNWRGTGQELLVAVEELL